MHLFSIHQMEKASKNICIQQSWWSQYIFEKFDLINYEAQKKNNTTFFKFSWFWYIFQRIVASEGILEM